MFILILVVVGFICSATASILSHFDFDKEIVYFFYTFSTISIIAAVVFNGFDQHETIERLREENTYLENRLQSEKADNLKLQKQLDLDPEKRDNRIKILKDSVKLLKLEAELKSLKAAQK